MSIYEFLSIASIVVSSVIAVAAIVVPALINYCNNRAKRKAEHIAKTYEERLQIIDSINTAYVMWRIDESKRNDFIITLFRLSYRFYGTTSTELIEFAETLLSGENSKTQLELAFHKCIHAIYAYLGIEENEITKKRDLTTEVLRKNIPKK